MKHHKPITKLPTLAQGGAGGGDDGADTLKAAQSAFFVTLTNQIIDIVYSKRR
jgi:hypothetical protein